MTDGKEHVWCDIGLAGVVLRVCVYLRQEKKIVDVTFARRQTLKMSRPRLAAQVRRLRLRPGCRLRPGKSYTASGQLGARERAL